MSEGTEKYGEEDLKKGIIIQEQMTEWINSSTSSAFSLIEAIAQALASERAEAENKIKDLTDRLAYYEHGNKIKEVHFDEAERMELEKKMRAYRDIAIKYFTAANLDYFNEEGFFKATDINHRSSKIVDEQAERLMKEGEGCLTVYQLGKITLDNQTRLG